MFLQTAYYSLIQVFNAVCNFQTKAPYSGTLAELFLTTEMQPHLGWSKATLSQPVRTQTDPVNHRGGSPVPVISGRLPPVPLPVELQGDTGRGTAVASPRHLSAAQGLMLFICWRMLRGPLGIFGNGTV